MNIRKQLENILQRCSQNKDVISAINNLNLEIRMMYPSNEGLGGLKERRGQLYMQITDQNYSQDKVLFALIE